jgi:hypothetical protein
MCAVHYHSGKYLRVFNQCLPSRRIKKTRFEQSVIDVYRAEGMSHFLPLFDARHFLDKSSTGFLARQRSLDIPDTGRQGAFKHKC